MIQTKKVYALKNAKGEDVAYITSDNNYIVFRNIFQLDFYIFRVYPAIIWQDIPDLLNIIYCFANYLAFEAITLS